MAQQHPGEHISTWRGSRSNSRGCPCKMSNSRAWSATAQTREGQRRNQAGAAFDPLIGTHRILGKNDSIFEDLSASSSSTNSNVSASATKAIGGLRAAVRVSALSTTPIPRAAATHDDQALRELSLIAAPPVDQARGSQFRLALRPADHAPKRCCASVIAAARRFSFARASTISRRRQQLLRENLPDRSSSSRMGKSSQPELEEKMSAFYNSGYDILISTDHRRIPASTFPTPIR